MVTIATGKPSGEVLELDLSPRPGPPNPRPRVGIADLFPIVNACPACGGDMFALLYDPSRFPDPHGRSPELPASAARFVPGRAAGRTCRRCNWLRARARLINHVAPDVVDPVRALRAELRSPTAASELPEPDPSALFDVGAIDTSAAAVRAGEIELNLPTALARQALEDLARERHAHGDHGLVGLLSDGDADRGARLGPLAEIRDQNAASVRDGHGSVRGAYALGRATFSVWSELGAGTLIYVPDDGVKID
jgi:hypothetical protein